MTGHPDVPVPLRIVVADDQASVRQGLVVLLGTLPEIEVVASAANGEEAIRLVAEKSPHAPAQPPGAQNRELGRGRTGQEIRG